MKRVLVTGAGGFVGQSITAALQEAGYQPVGADRRADPGKDLLLCNLREKAEVEKLLGDVKPDGIVHLAAQSSAGKSFETPLETIQENVLPALFILEHLRTGKSKARFLVVGSADSYGLFDKADLPLKETRPLEPRNPYALSKAIQEECCIQYSALYGVDAVMTRSFNHTGAGQRDTFVLPSFAKQIVEIKKGLKKPVIEVGNIDVRRDFLDVRDVGRAYIALLKKGVKGGIYNVCSGRSHSLRELLEKMCGIAAVELDIKVKDERLRPVDIEELVGDNLKLREDTGWKPAIPIEDTLRSLLDHWDRQLESANGGAPTE